MSIIYWFPNVQYLSIIDCSIDVNATAVHFPHLKHFEVFIQNSIPGALIIEDIQNLFQSNKHVQEIVFLAPVEFKFSTALDLINEHTSLMGLTVLVTGKIAKDVAMVDLNRFAAKHPSVEVVLFFTHYRFTVDDVIHFIGKLSKLMYFRF